MDLKTVISLLLCILLLTGCGSAPVFEGMEDVYAPQTQPQPKELQLTLPKDAAAQTLSGETGKLYFCDGYELSLETLPSGDLNSTLQLLTGYGRDLLTIMETGTSTEKRFETVWVAAGEDSDRVGRLLVIDDGSYHYCVSVMADVSEAGALQKSWEALFSGVVLG